MIYIYAPYGFDTSYGIGYICHLFQRTFPQSQIITGQTRYMISDLERRDILIYPRIFFHPYPHIYEDTYALINTKAKVIQYLFWDLETLPRVIANSIGKADVLGAPTQFVAKLFRPHGNIVVFPPPVKEFRKREFREPRERKVIGAVLASLHGRKNLPGYIKLATLLSQHLFKIVIPTDWRNYDVGAPFVERLILLPNVVVYDYLTESELESFYHSLDWFVTLTGGEAFGLPVFEALKCGVPVIAPKHSAFAEFEGVKGLRLVDTEIYSGSDIKGVENSLLRFPKVDDVAKVIEGEYPTEVESPTPTFDEWRAFWAKIVDELEKKAQARIWMQKETPAFFALYNTNLGLGLNSVSIRWARRTGSETFCVYQSLPEGVESPIIVPYAESHTDFGGHLCNNTFLLATQLKLKNPKAPIVLWVHGSFNFDIYNLLRGVVDCFCGTTPLFLSHYPFKVYLMHPIGDPPSGNGAQNSYFLGWGVNVYTLAWYERFLNYFPLPVKFIVSLTVEIPSDVMRYLRRLDFLCKGSKYPRDFMCGLPLDDDEMEILIDGAAGYLCFDLVYNAPVYEASARIPHVLRKGRPILANDAPRNLVWSDYIKVMRFSQPLKLADDAAVKQFVEDVVGRLDEFVPRKVPPVEVELMHFHKFLSIVKDEWRARSNS